MLDNQAELEAVLREQSGLGPVFARHVYGMRRWVDLFAERIPQTDDLVLAELLAEIVAENARHAALFRERAQAHGVDPDAYRCPPEGEAIYLPIPELDLAGLMAYSLGSLEHFAELLSTYAAVAEGEDAAALRTVLADNELAIARLTAMLDDSAERWRADAHERYRRRELVEAHLYAHAG